MEVVATTGAVTRAKLQSNRHHQQTNTQLFTVRMLFLSPNQRCQSNERCIEISSYNTLSFEGTRCYLMWPQRSGSVKCKTKPVVVIAWVCKFLYKHNHGAVYKLRALWKNWICSTTMKLRKSLVKPVTWQNISSCSVLPPEIVMQDEFNVILWMSADICVVHDDLVIAGFLPCHRLYEWFSWVEQPNNTL